ncbi:MAG: ABC transporter ATP-binding protein [Bacteroidales bacterium]|nr:ABC transporter ATP-binding protein [Bacteroidales bacterium]
MNILELESLNYAYPGARRGEAPIAAVADVSFQIAEGENVGLVGANGAGKSTLLKLICGLLEPTGGHVSVAGTEVRKETLGQIRKDLGYVFQDSDDQLFTSTVYDDIAFGPRNYGYTPEQTRAAVEKALAAVHIESLKDRAVFRLSGGEKKLAAIATVLSMGSRLMLLDEPSVGLDPRNRRNLMEVIQSLPCAKLIASHDLDFIYDTCSRVVVLFKGRAVRVGDTRQILADRAFLEANGLELPLSFVTR